MSGNVDDVRPLPSAPKDLEFIEARRRLALFGGHWPVFERVERDDSIKQVALPDDAATLLGGVPPENAVRIPPGGYKPFLTETIGPDEDGI